MRLSEVDKIHRSFVIGGASLYAQVLALPSVSQPIAPDRILLTHIVSPAFEQCDVFMPAFKDGLGWLRASHLELQAWVDSEVPDGVQEEGDTRYEFQMWVRQL